MTRRKKEIFPRALGFSPYIWLVYIVIPLFNMAFERGIKMVLGYVMIAIFIAAYRQLFFSERSTVFWLAVQMLIIVTLSLFYLPFYTFMGFFTANFIGNYQDNRKFRIALAAFAATILLPILGNVRNLDVSDYLTLVPFIMIMLMTPFGMRSMNLRKQLELQLNEAKEQIEILVKKEERLRIARDLHDTLGHTLSLLTLKSQLVQRLTDKDPEKARLEAREMEETSRAALRQVRELVSDMRTLTVAEEIEEVRSVLNSADIALDCEGDTRLAGIPDLTQNILSMCLKEATTNIIKHSRATACKITIRQETSDVRMVIRDNGVGLEEGGMSTSHGNGLKGMSERLALIDGTLELSSSGGTELSITVPIIIKGKESVTA
ncbi:sensor histidine kinase [Paenibacillus sp. XY044]|uniref:sensor histidine kinase n=1 Tax=Paenibacillus sp. XY044 TaxID=2026089 RepID=UPI00211B1D5A|nr:sensor histidine kinase [Paenibacillus sp. XY044]